MGVLMDRYWCEIQDLIKHVAETSSAIEWSIILVYNSYS